MNFAEQLAYWYLRLNGFFPLANFVMHQIDGERTSDADLIAVRFPHVTEDVGGTPTDWDDRFSNDWKIDLTKETIALIVEVKSGRWTRSDIMNGAEWKTRYAIRRTGIIPEDRVSDTSRALQQAASVHNSGTTIARMVIGSPAGKGEHDPFLFLDLRDVEHFIRNRMESFKHRKRPDRLFFSGDLIQYLAWSGDGSES